MVKFDYITVFVKTLIIYVIKTNMFLIHKFINFPYAE